MHANVFGIEDPRHHIWKKVFITRGAATQAVFRGYLTHLENETWRKVRGSLLRGKACGEKANSRGCGMADHRIPACRSARASTMSLNSPNGAMAGDFNSRDDRKTVSGDSASAIWALLECDRLIIV